jgi:hypothetical protein
MSFFDKLFGIKKEVYGFVDEPVELIMTSDITGHYKDPNGIFKCENPECDSVGTKRYKSRPNESVPDVLPCPICGHNMVNHGLEILCSQSLQNIKRTSSGTPEQYKAAIEGIDIFLRLYNAEGKEEWEAPEVPSLQVAAEIASMIFDDNIIAKVNSVIKQIQLFEETVANISESLDQRKIYEAFFQRLPIGEPTKQTDLVKDFKLSYPELNIDPTWLFYVWSNFGLVTRTKEKNRVYFKRLA